MIRPIALAEAHMECRKLDETVPALTDFLAFEKVAEAPGTASLKHPNTPWLLVIHEAGKDAPEKPTAHHMGVRVEHKQEVEAAWQYLNDHKDQYGLYGMREPVYGHGSYSLHFREPGSNDWEIECYEDVLRKESGGARLGGVRSRHWQSEWSSDRFADHGYLPQAFTHGTLHTDDAETCGQFMREVLGLDAHKAYSKVIYVKHPDTKHFVVCLQGGVRNDSSDNFRFTLTLESPDKVVEARDSLARRADELHLTGVGPVREDANGTSFLLRDPDNNCWELASR